jgi:hypothetical protein
MPFLAISMIPLEKTEPSITPAAAIKIIVRNAATLLPIAEFKKLTASLLTPTMRSVMANRNRTITINIRKVIFDPINDYSLIIFIQPKK